VGQRRQMVPVQTGPMGARGQAVQFRQRTVAARQEGAAGERGDEGASVRQQIENVTLPDAGAAAFGISATGAAKTPASRDSEYFSSEGPPGLNGPLGIATSEAGSCAAARAAAEFHPDRIAGEGGSPAWDSKGMASCREVLGAEFSSRSSAPPIGERCGTTRQRRETCRRVEP
jgi:hypothetical protein